MWRWTPLATFGVTNELRSPSLIIEGVDPGPVSSQNAQDNRAALTDVAHLLQLEAGSPDEIYQLTRLATNVSQRMGMPVLLRVHERALAPRGDVHEAPPELPEGSLMTFSRAAGPFISTAATYRYHVEKRARRLRQLQPLVEALAVKTVIEGNRAVVLGGTLGPLAHARAWARRLSTVRLGASWPLPRQALMELMKGCDELLVLEEGEPFLERELQAFAHREWLECRVRGAGGARPQKLDDERIDTLLSRFGGRVKADVDPVVRTTADWKAAAEALAAVGDDDGEPWPLLCRPPRPEDEGLFAQRSAGDAADEPAPARAADHHRRRSGHDRRARHSRSAGRRQDAHGLGGAGGRRAGRRGRSRGAGRAAPLAVALIGDTNHYHSELLGVLDNAIAKREVLHVLVVNRRSEMTAGVKRPI